MGGTDVASSGVTETGLIEMVNIDGGGAAIDQEVMSGVTELKQKLSTLQVYGCLNKENS